MPGPEADIDLSPLAFLHQVVHTVHFDEPFVALAELRRSHQPSSTILFTVCVGLPPGRSDPTRPEVWWTNTWTSAELEQMFDVSRFTRPDLQGIEDKFTQLPGIAVLAKNIPARFQARWNEGHLHLQSVSQRNVELRKDLTLAVHVTESLNFALKLSPCAMPTISPLSVVARVSKDAHDAVASKLEARSLRKERDALQTANQRLENNLKRKTEELQNAGTRSTQGGSQTSPKKPNVALMRKRAGQQVRVQTDDFQPESDSD
ncbi:hypothetical protein OIV83_002807 [Microbotryomycetes sp. JL201]|nr:hypothetical protein OIV83_002807 [Microbotryomycetes sp. JL201]